MPDPTLAAVREALTNPLPCAMRDWPADNCLFWFERYGQEPCDNCRSRIALLASLDGMALVPADEVVDLVTLVRIGFLVRVAGERATPDAVHAQRHRDLLDAILTASDTDAAVAALRERGAGE